MIILVACEYSGVVRDAFENQGHDAWSCDLLPTESEQTVKAGKHIQGDVLKILNDNWDIMIAHPPCTYLSYAGMSNWYDEGRAMKRIKAAEFFMQLWEAPIPKICIENPRGIMSKIFRKPEMEMHPYYFGDKEMKRTNLWLKNLPILKFKLENDLFGEKTATDIPEPVKIQIRKKTGKTKKRYWHDIKFCDPHRRSRTFPGIANAMAEQWGNTNIKKYNGIADKPSAPNCELTLPDNYLITKIFFLQLHYC